MPHDINVLIVEDDDDARRNMEDILSLDGYKIQSVSHCLPAIEAVERDSFVAVIVDWKLPDSNADQLIPIIIKHQPDTPVVVVTGMREFDTAVKALRSGAYDFLLKPINADVLRSVLRRIVERKKHLAAIEEAREKLLMNERLAAIGQMVTGLAHESRNAFQRSHACLAELSLDLQDRPESLELVRKIQKALDDVHQLLEEVRDYSAPIILNRCKCCLEKNIRETWNQILDAKPGLAKPEFAVLKQAGFPSDCVVDCDRIRQVFRNLLENALFACANPGEVKVHMNTCNGQIPILRIEISDNGEGIAEKERETIFAPFFTTKTKGTGLGLSLCRRYVDAHGGRIFADGPNSSVVDGSNSSEDPQGARFVIELPYRKK